MTIQFTNAPEDGTALPAPVFMLTGTVDEPTDGIIVVENDQSPTQNYEVVDGQFKLYLQLGYGENNLNVKHVDGGVENGILAPGDEVYDETDMWFNVEAPTPEGFQVPKVHLCLYVGNGSPGTFDCPEGYEEPNNVETAVRKLKVGGRLMQLHMLDEMYSAGFNGRTFLFDEEEDDNRMVPKVHVITSSLSPEEIRDCDPEELFDVIKDDLRSRDEAFGSKTPTIALVMILDSTWDSDEGRIWGTANMSDTSESLQVATFGSVGLHSWPDCWEAVFEAFTDTEEVDGDEVWTDSGKAGNLWQCLNQSLGGFYTMLGTVLGTSLVSEGITSGDLHLNRKFLSKERDSPDGGEWGPVTNEDAPGWGRLNDVRFLLHPAFSLEDDFDDSSFRPKEVDEDVNPSFSVVDEDTVQIAAKTGVFAISMVVDGCSRLHFEMLPEYYDGLKPRKSVDLRWSVIQDRLDDKWKDKKVRVEVFTVGGGEGSVDDMRDFLESG